MAGYRWESTWARGNNDRYPLHHECDNWLTEGFRARGPKARGREIPRSTSYRARGMDVDTGRYSRGIRVDSKVILATQGHRVNFRCYARTCTQLRVLPI